MFFKKTFCNFILGTIPLLTFSQQAQETQQQLQYLEKHQVTAQLVGPGLRYEAGLLDPISFSTEISPGFTTHRAGSNISYAWQNRLRLYIDLVSRFNKNKNIKGNSGDYVALANSVFFGNLQLGGSLDAPEDFTMVFNGGLYGVQRTYPQGFNFSAELGVGHYQGRDMADGFGVLLNLSFGWVLTRRK